MQTKFMCIGMYACTHGQGVIFISLSSSNAGHMMYDVWNQTVTQLCIQSDQLYVAWELSMLW